MNKKGFAISGIIYSLLILFLLLLFSILSIMGARKMILDKLKNDVMSELNDDNVSIEQGKSLISILLTQYQEGNQVGLVKDDSNPNLYYYTGTNEEVSNNFLWYGGHQWRVLEFDTSEKSLTLITQQPLTAIQLASTVWTSEETYNQSYINTWLNDYFWNSLDSSIQSNILDNTFNVGIYTDVDEISTTKKIGLLDNNQYVRAGGANSYLDIKDYFWLGNRYDSINARLVVYNGNFNNESPLFTSGVRAVIKISDLKITKGDGTLVNSYYTTNKSTNTNNIQVGEYINVPYNGSDNACGTDKMCTFRVVNKDNNSIKVIFNGLLPTESKWAINADDNIQATDYIYINVLNLFINNIDSKYITTGTYGVGIYSDDNFYLSPQEAKITANIGLPTIGEMFCGNDIDLNNNLTTFVDINTIENQNLRDRGTYWTMNRYSSSYVRSVQYLGTLSLHSASEYQYARPVIYLKSGTSALNFTGGNGTAQSPYTLE